MIGTTDTCKTCKAFLTRKHASSTLPSRRIHVRDGKRKLGQAAKSTPPPTDRETVERTQILENFEDAETMLLFPPPLLKDLHKSSGGGRAE
ncbi:hypothetical protein GN956_G13895 [Arapaima gigas]